MHQPSFCKIWNISRDAEGICTLKQNNVSSFKLTFPTCELVLLYCFLYSYGSTGVGRIMNWDQRLGIFWREVMALNPTCVVWSDHLWFSCIKQKESLIFAFWSPQIVGCFDFKLKISGLANKIFRVVLKQKLLKIQGLFIFFCFFLSWQI